MKMTVNWHIAPCKFTGVSEVLAATIITVMMYTASNSGKLLPGYTTSQKAVFFKTTEIIPSTNLMHLILQMNLTAFCIKLINLTFVVCNRRRVLSSVRVLY
jgi:hypothetical protein